MLPCPTLIALIAILVCNFLLFYNQKKYNLVSTGCSLLNNQLLFHQQVRQVQLTLRNSQLSSFNSRLSTRHLMFCVFKSNKISSLITNYQFLSLVLLFLNSPTYHNLLMHRSYKNIMIKRIFCSTTRRVLLDNTCLQEDQMFFVSTVVF